MCFDKKVQSREKGSYGQSVRMRVRMAALRELPAFCVCT